MQRITAHPSYRRTPIGRLYNELNSMLNGSTSPAQHYGRGHHPSNYLLPMMYNLPDAGMPVGLRHPSDAFGRDIYGAPYWWHHSGHDPLVTMGEWGEPVPPGQGVEPTAAQKRRLRNQQRLARRRGREDEARALAASNANDGPHTHRTQPKRLGERDDGIEIQPRLARDEWNNPFWVAPFTNSVFDWSPWSLPEAAFPDLWTDPNADENELLSMNQMRTDIHEEEDKYVLHAEVPGVDKDSIRITIRSNVLTIRAEKRVEKVEGDAEPAPAEEDIIKAAADDLLVEAPVTAVGETPPEESTKPGAATGKRSKKPKGAEDTAGEVQKVDTRELASPEQGHYYRRQEIIYGVIQRSFTLPPDVDVKKVDATYADGVLTVELPKLQGAQQNVEVRQRQKQQQDK